MCILMKSCGELEWKKYYPIRFNYVLTECSCSKKTKPVIEKI